MNRAMRRKMDKQLRTKLTDEQFQELKSKTISEMIDIEVKRRLDDTWSKMSSVLIEIMRKNRISQERIHKIVSEFSEEIYKRYGRDNDEGLSE